MTKPGFRFWFCHSLCGQTSVFMPWTSVPPRWGWGCRTAAGRGGRVLLQGAGSVAVVPGCGPVLLPNIPKT